MPTPQPARYAGDRAVVVGATGGLGRSFVTELLDHGCDVALTYHRNRAAAGAHLAHATVRERRCFAYALDLRNRADIEGCCRQIEADLGTPSIIVNCAGVTRDRPIATMSGDEWDDVIETNLSGPFHVLRQFAPAMMRRGGGRIVNVASVSGMAGVAGQSNYAASKGGLIALTRAMARELGPFRITVNAVAPGLVDTEMTAGMSASQRRRLLERIPLRRFATAADVVSAARVLLQSECEYVTGHVLVVDGGLTA